MVYTHTNREQYIHIYIYIYAPHHIDTDTQVYIQDTFDIDSTHTCLASRFRCLTLQCAAGRHSEVLVLASVKMLHCRRIQYITVHNTIYIYILYCIPQKGLLAAPPSKTEESKDLNIQKNCRLSSLQPSWDKP